MDAMMLLVRVVGLTMIVGGVALLGTLAGPSMRRGWTVLRELLAATGDVQDETGPDEWASSVAARQRTVAVDLTPHMFARLPGNDGVALLEAIESVAITLAWREAGNERRDIHAVEVLALRPGGHFEVLVTFCECGCYTVGCRASEMAHRFPALMVCAWCGDAMPGRVAVAAGETSHGICAPCLARELATVRELAAGRATAKGATP